MYTPPQTLFAILAVILHNNPMARKTTQRPKESFPPCAVYGCTEPGEFRAPASRESLEKYQHLCLEHVRKFNQAWDYFNGWKQDEIEAFMHSSVHGHRPTWNIHKLTGKQGSFTKESLEEALHRMMGNEPPPRRKKHETKEQRKRREALAVMNLEPDADIKTIKTTYKMLVKKYHPDVNSGKDAEETFKRITEAYSTLLKAKENT